MRNCNATSLFGRVSQVSTPAINSFFRRVALFYHSGSAFYFASVLVNSFPAIDTQLQYAQALLSYCAMLYVALSLNLLLFCLFAVHPFRCEFIEKVKP